jgi:hypothetical protein
MKFDVENNLPVDEGADTKADSARLAGMMALVGHPKAPDLRQYFVNGHPVRHPYATLYPENHPRVMSRDQIVCLAAGMRAQGHGAMLKVFDGKWFAPNNMHEIWNDNGTPMFGKWKMPDLYAPHVRAHITSRYPSSIELQFLALDIYLSGKFQPLHEQNQLQALVLTMEALEPGWVKFYVKCNPQWERATWDYWVTNRLSYCKGEPELAQMIINTIKSK